MLSAMDIFLIAAALLAAAVVLVPLVKVVRSGGGTLPAPPAHEWTSAEQAPERPYRDLPRVA